MQVKEYRAGERIADTLRKRQEQQEMAAIKAALQDEKVLDLLSTGAYGVVAGPVETSKREKA